MIKLNLNKFFSTINKEEVKKFSNIKNWWDNNGEMRILHSYNKARIDFMKNTLMRYKPNNEFKFLNNLNCLDIGCGGGMLSESMARLGGKVVGIDANEDCIKNAKDHLKISDLKIDYINTLIENYDNDNNNNFDLITAMEIIEHIDDNKKEFFIDNMKNLLKKDGILFVSTINKSSISYMYNIFFAEKVTGLVEDGTHDYDKFISPEDLIIKFDKLKMELLNLNYFLYNPINNNFEKDLIFKTNYVAAFRLK